MLLSQKAMIICLIFFFLVLKNKTKPKTLALIPFSQQFFILRFYLHNEKCLIFLVGLVQKLVMFQKVQGIELLDLVSAETTD